MNSKEDLEQAFEDMNFIIQQNGYTRCDYCIFKNEPCFVKDRNLNAICQFEYCAKEYEDEE